MKDFNPVDIGSLVNELYTSVGVNPDVINFIEAFSDALKPLMAQNASTSSQNSQTSTSSSNLSELRTADACVKSEQLRSAASFYTKDLTDILGVNPNRTDAENIIIGLIREGKIESNALDKIEDQFFKVYGARKAGLLEYLDTEDIKDVLGKNSSEAKLIIEAKNIVNDKKRYMALSNINQRVFDKLANNSQKNENTAKFFEINQGIFIMKSNDTFKSEGVYNDGALNSFICDAGKEAKAYMKTISDKLNYLGRNELIRLKNVGAAYRNIFFNSGAIYTAHIQNDTFSKLNPNRISRGFSPGSSMANYANGLQARARREVNVIYSNPTLRNQYAIYGESALDPYSNLNNPLVSFNNNPYGTNSYGIYDSELNPFDSDYRRGWS